MTTSEETKTQEQANASSIISAQNGEIQCHSLPCKVDFTGRAPVEVYFSPQLVSDGSSTNQEEGKNTEESKDDRIYSVHFRGRQLLAKEPYQHPLPATCTTGENNSSNDQKTATAIRMQGRLLEIDACKARTSQDKIKVKGTFRSILEWKHECEPAVLRNSAADSRVRAALQWCDVAQAVSKVKYVWSASYWIIMMPSAWFFIPSLSLTTNFRLLHVLYCSCMIQFLSSQARGEGAGIKRNEYILVVPMGACNAVPV